MLYDVLQAIENASGPVLLSDLSRELAIAPDMLRDILAFWQRKGRLGVQASAGVSNACATGGDHAAHCGSGCSGTANCLFTARIPTHSIITLTRPEP